MIVIDEYVAVYAVLAEWPQGLPDDELALPASRHWRLLQALHAPKGGQLSRVLSHLPDSDQAIIRHPLPSVFQVLDPRPLLDDAAAIAARYGGTGLLIAETLAASLTFGKQAWFGTPSNVGRVIHEAAGELDITLHVIGSTGR